VATLEQGIREAEGVGMAAPTLVELTHTERLVAPMRPMLHYGTLDSQVADGQALLTNHKHHGQSSFCAASCRDQNDRSGSCTRSSTGPSHGSSNVYRDLHNALGNPMKADS